MQLPYSDGIAQKLRLASGLILFAFATTHFLNHAVGLVQIEAMHEVQQWRWVITRSWLGSIILGGALLTHITLGLIKLANRATLRLAPWELLQIGLGLAIPVLLFPHIVNTRVASTFFGVQDNYLYELARLWPGSAATQSALLLLVWIHGCLGIHYWLRLDRRYQILQPVLLLVAVAIPLAGLAGFMVSGRAVAALMEDPVMSARIREITHWPTPSDEDLLASYRLSVRLGFLVLVLMVAAYMAWRHFLMLAAPKILVAYTGGPSVRTAVGPTLLEISRANGVAHAAACGGRARCTACRVRIEQGADSLTQPQFAETAALATIGTPKDTRLACQLRPQSSLSVTRLVRAHTTGPEAGNEDETEAAGVEQPLAVLFVGMNHFAELLRGRLAYDIVFILNEFYAAVGTVITDHTGRIDKCFGDTVLAVFGQQHGLEAGCRQAVRAAHAIDVAIDRLNEKISAEIGRPVEVAMGIHAGRVFLGRIGYGNARELSVVGGVVDTSMQLKAFAQKSGHQIVLSAETARIAGLPASGSSQTVTLGTRDDGAAEAIDVFTITHGRNLPIDTLV
jgi:adenylate cyclase